jgi:hypothetical protein
MNNNDITLAKWTVVARYMTGTTLDAYFLTSDSGEYEKANKERAIFLIGKGLVANLRMQSNNGEVLIRGSGINLNTLPIIDTPTNTLRNREDVSKRVADIIDRATQSKKSRENPAAQLTITKRVMYKTACKGYELINLAGKKAIVHSAKCLEYAEAGRISNATVQKITENGAVKIILRGKEGVNLAKLPTLYMDSEGQIVDPTNDEVRVYMRGVRMSQGGMLHDVARGTKNFFNVGDFLICGVNAKIAIARANQMESAFEVAKGVEKAFCDDYLEVATEYKIEIHGKAPSKLNPESIRKWTVLLSKPRKVVETV